MVAFGTESARSDSQWHAALQQSGGLWNRAIEPGPVRVLVVDDDAGIRWLIRRILEMAGYAVVAAGDGAAAVRTTVLAMTDPRCAIQLVLTDLDMPGLDGFEVGRGLLARWPALRVIYMSGTTFGLSHRTRLSLDEHFIEKPFLADTLLRKVSLVLHVEPPVRSSAGMLRSSEE
jgi:CheY-like chemotaxis protein